MLEQNTAKNPYSSIVADELAKLTLIIQVKSGGSRASNKATITLNGDDVKLFNNMNGHQRGIHLVVINVECCVVNWC